MTPIVRYMLICDDVRPDADFPTCTHIDCLMSTIISGDEPAFPLLRETICVYLVLTDCQGQGTGQIRVAFADAEHEKPIFGSAPHPLDFTGRSPLELLGIAFRIKDCRFPQGGRYYGTILVQQFPCGRAPSRTEVKDEPRPQQE